MTNKMDEIAAMFGKEMGEEFAVKYRTGKYKWAIQYHATFEYKGLAVFGKNKDVIFRKLLIGEAVIINERE